MSSREKLLSVVLALAVAGWWVYEPAKTGADALNGPSELRSMAQAKVAPEKMELDPDTQSRNKNAIDALLALDRIPVEDIEHFGYSAIPILTELYRESADTRKKSRIAHVFWRLGWQSTEIEDALMDDLDAKDPYLKVQVQWGIAKSTQSNKVIEKLLHNLENDPSPFVRDKAACALASDFVHISPEQRLNIISGLIGGLSNEIKQVRSSSILALKIHTGQTKGFVAADTLSNRNKSIERWNLWLTEYEQNL